MPYTTPFRSGPTIANMVSIRALKVRRDSLSDKLILPSAPSMSPRCAESRTADGRGSGIPTGVCAGVASVISGSATVITAWICGGGVGRRVVGGALDDGPRCRFSPSPVVGDGEIGRAHV